VGHAPGAPPPRMRDGPTGDPQVTLPVGAARRRVHRSGLARPSGSQAARSDTRTPLPAPTAPAEQNRRDLEYNILCRAASRTSAPVHLPPPLPPLRVLCIASLTFILEGSGPSAHSYKSNLYLSHHPLGSWPLPFHGPNICPFFQGSQTTRGFFFATRTSQLGQSQQQEARFLICISE